MTNIDSFLHVIGIQRDIMTIYLGVNDYENSEGLELWYRCYATARYYAPDNAIADIVLVHGGG